MRPSTLAALLLALASPLAGVGTHAASLRDFGAAPGDGSDTTPTIRAAMAATTSPAIYIPSGTYRLLPGTYVAGSSVSLIGDGMGKTVLQLPPGCKQVGNLLVWLERSHVTIQDLTLDLNGCIADGLSGALALTGGADVRLLRVAIVRAGPGKWLQVSINGVSHGWILESRLEFLAAQAIQNQAINISSAYAQADDWRIAANTLVNSGAIVNSAHLEFTSNTVSGWGYGAGISTSPTLSPDAVISGNLIHDSATGVDQDGTWPNGIEGWGQRQVTSGNTITNVAGSCIFVGGRGQRITDNVCTGAGKRSDGAGAPAIQIGYVTATQNGSFSCLLHNTVWNDGTGTTTFGLSDQAGVVGVYVPPHANAFAGAPVRVLGAPAATREPLC